MVARCMGCMSLVACFDLHATTTEDDVRLVREMANGDRAAFSALYSRYASTMLSVARRILGGKVERESEDLLHDVFMEVWRRAGSYERSRGTVRTWLLLRVRCRAIDRRRSARVSKGVLTDDFRSLAEEPTGEDPALATDRRAVREALLSLPEAQRQVLVLTYFEGLSSSEIAEQLGVPMGTVKSRVAAGRSRLRELIMAGGMTG